MPGRLIGDDQDVLAVIALKVLGLISRKAHGEVMLAAQLEFGRSQQQRVGHLGALDQPMDLGPQLGPHLPLGGRGGQHDAVLVAR